MKGGGDRAVSLPGDGWCDLSSWRRGEEGKRSSLFGVRAFVCRGWLGPGRAILINMGGGS